MLYFIHGTKFRFYHFILITIYDLDINELIDANVHIKYSEL